MFVVSNPAGTIISVVPYADKTLIMRITTPAGFVVFKLNPEEAADLATVLLYWVKEGKFT